MAARATLTGRVLIQIGDEEPIEIGTVEIPVQVRSVYRTKGHEHVTLDIANHHAGDRAKYIATGDATHLPE